MNKKTKIKGFDFKQFISSLIIVIILCFIYYFISDRTSGRVLENYISSNTSFNIDDIPEYTDKPYVIINGNKPKFSEEETKRGTFEEYGELDYLGRCTVAYACVGKETMPTEKRGDISMIKPTGWRVSKYDFIEGKLLYNRCHLIGYLLTAENDNEKNLITGTRYMNVEGMLPFEEKVAGYIRKTNNHVLYRVTPIFKENELVSRGVQMEAKSVEDNGKGICFNVYVYNVQPSININYKDGKNWLKNDII